MSNHTDLAARIDSAIGEGPPEPALDGLLAAGRRAGARRRLVQGSATLALVLALGGGALALVGTGGSSASPAPPVATEPPVPDDDPSEPAVPDDDPSETASTPTPYPDQLATLGQDGLKLRKGVVLVEQAENPLGVRPPNQSLALVLERDGNRYWMLLEESPQGGSSSVERAGGSYSTFDLWLDQAVALQQGKPLLALVAFDQGESLSPAEKGVEIVEQRSSPPLPPDFERSERSAVAEVIWQGAQWFVLATQSADSQPLYLPVEASVAGSTTIDEYLDWAWERYDSELARERARSEAAK